MALDGWTLLVWFMFCSSVTNRCCPPNHHSPSRISFTFSKWRRDCKAKEIKATAATKMFNSCWNWTDDDYIWGVAREQSGFSNAMLACPLSSCKACGTYAKGLWLFILEVPTPSSLQVLFLSPLFYKLHSAICPQNFKWSHPPWHTITQVPVLSLETTLLEWCHLFTQRVY